MDKSEYVCALTVKFCTLTPTRTVSQELYISILLVVPASEPPVGFQAQYYDASLDTMRPRASSSGIILHEFPKGIDQTDVSPLLCHIRRATPFFPYPEQIDRAG